MYISRMTVPGIIKVVSAASRFSASPTSAPVHFCRCIEVSNLLPGCHRLYSTDDKNKTLTEVKSKSVPSQSFQQVKENTKTASYLGVILVGLSVTGVMFYAVFRELFSSKSPNNVYSSALERCCSEARILNALGEPIKGFGEETRRGRRRHVSHLFYEKDGVHYLRMKFYIQGCRRRGTVHVEMKEDEKGKFVYRYLIVEVNDYPQEIIVLEDNRYETASTADILGDSNLKLE